jgi:hypothetical protein
MGEHDGDTPGIIHSLVNLSDDVDTIFIGEGNVAEPGKKITKRPFIRKDVRTHHIARLPRDLNRRGERRVRGKIMPARPAQ